jgi:hypothetical protein
MSSNEKKRHGKDTSDEMKTKRTKSDIEPTSKRPRSYLKFLDQIAQRLEVKYNYEKGSKERCVSKF